MFRWHYDILYPLQEALLTVLLTIRVKLYVTERIRGGVIKALAAGQAATAVRP